MKIFTYLIEFIAIKILFNFFSIIGYRNSSNLGFLIGKTFGSIFRSKKLITKNIKKANLRNKNDLYTFSIFFRPIDPETVQNRFVLSKQY